MLKEGELQKAIEKEVVTEFELVLDSLRKVAGKKNFENLISKYGISSGGVSAPNLATIE